MKIIVFYLDNTFAELKISITSAIFLRPSIFSLSSPPSLRFVLLLVQTRGCSISMQNKVVQRTQQNTTCRSFNQMNTCTLTPLTFLRIIHVNSSWQFTLYSLNSESHVIMFLCHVYYIRNLHNINIYFKKDVFTFNEVIFL